LRRLMMTETSKGRRITGKLAILATAAIALPLTATVVPVLAEDDPAAEDQNSDKKVEVKKHKVVIVKNQDGKPVRIDVSGDKDTPFVKTIEKDGKTIVLHSTKELSEAEVEKMVEDAEKSRAEADAWASGEGGAKQRTRVVVKSDVDSASSHSFSWSADGEGVAQGMNISAYIPDIDIKEFRGKCAEGQPVSTNVSGFDGQNKSRVSIVMCGKGYANLARREAIQGLKEALDEMRGESDMPESIRKDVTRKLEEKIEDLEKQIKDEPSEADDA
jgi:bla regulator protein blaR1